jgi:hypothetical protein
MLLMRSSELDQPMAPGHFLSEFGQSQRRLPDAGQRNGSVPQLLMMMNGEAQTMLTNPNVSLIFKDIATLATPKEKIECVFLSMLSRKPTASELERAQQEISKSENGYADLTWALLNTLEFMFVQ